MAFENYTNKLQNMVVGLSRMLQLLETDYGP